MKREHEFRARANMLSARKRTKTPVAPTCRPKSPYSFFFGEPSLFLGPFESPA